MKMVKSLLTAIVMLPTLWGCSGAWSADVTPYAKQQPPLVAAAPANWNGWYMGLFAGYGWGDGAGTLNSFSCANCNAASLAALNSNFPLTGPDLRRDGPVLGGQVGFDWQQGNWVMGIVDDIAWADIKGSSQVFSILQLTSKVTWMNNLDLRLGYLMTPGVLLYGIGGLTTAGINNNISTTITGVGITCVNAFCNGGASDTKWGWNAGLGLEGRVNRQASVFVDARYFKLPDSNFQSPGFLGKDPAFANISNKNEFGVFRVGLNWRPAQ